MWPVLGPAAQCFDQLLDFSVANATADLVMMAAWSCALSTIRGEPIPVCHMFALSSHDPDNIYRCTTSLGMIVYTEHLSNC